MSALGRGFVLLFLILPLLACGQSTPEQHPADTQPELAAPVKTAENSPSVADVAQPPPATPDQAPAQPQPTAQQTADAPEQYQEGKQYERINPPQPTEGSTGVEVTEVFWYACPHCYHVEPALVAWLKHKPANVTFIRMPAILNPNWELLARAFYSAEDLGVLDKIHEPMFHAIHEEHAPMSTDQDVIAFFTAHGVKEDDIRGAMASFSVETKLRRARQVGERYGLTGVPAIIVNGKYRTGVGMAGGNDAVFKVVDFLIKKESAAAHGN